MRATPKRGRATMRGTTRIAELGSVALLAAALIWVAANTGRCEFVAGNTTVVRVEAGESLWELAERHAPAGATTADTVEAIARLNEIEGGLLAVGSTIKVPADATEEQVASR